MPGPSPGGYPPMAPGMELPLKTSNPAARTAARIIGTILRYKQ